MRRVAAGHLGSALILVVTVGGLLTSAHVQAAEGDGLSSFFKQLFAPQPTYSAPSPAQVLPAAAPLDGGGGLWQGRGRQPDRGGLARRDRSSAQRLARAQEAAKKLKTRYMSLPKPEKVGGDDKPKAVDGRAAELAKAGDVQAALLQDSTLRAGDIVITANGPKVFVGSEREQHRARDFEEAARSRHVDDKTRRLLTAMVLPRGALAADEARKLMAKLLRAVPLNQEAALAARSANAAPRVISTALSQPKAAQ